MLSYNRDLGLVPNLLGAMGDLASSTQITMLRNATWTISNLCRGKPPPRWELIAGLLAPLVQLTFHSDDEVLVDACWALSYICEPADRIELLTSSGALPRLTALLAHASPNVQTPALRCIGNVATGTAEQTQAVLQCEALSAVGRLLVCGKKELKKEACWMISNVTAGSTAQIDAVCASGLVPALIRLVTEEEFDIKKEAACVRSLVSPGFSLRGLVSSCLSSCLSSSLLVLTSHNSVLYPFAGHSRYALCNACTGGSLLTVSGLVFHGVLGALCSLLDAPDAELLLAVLEALGSALEAGEASRESSQGVNRCIHLMDEAGGARRKLKRSICV